MKNALVSKSIMEKRSNTEFGIPIDLKLQHQLLEVFHRLESSLDQRFSTLELHLEPLFPMFQISLAQLELSTLCSSHTELVEI